VEADEVRLARGARDGHSAHDEECEESLHFRVLGQQRGDGTDEQQAQQLDRFPPVGGRSQGIVEEAPQLTHGRAVLAAVGVVAADVVATEKGQHEEEHEQQRRVQQ
jgi:hypothetical protein